jgi:hypothetical protein
LCSVLCRIIRTLFGQRFYFWNRSLPCLELWWHGNQ